MIDLKKLPMFDRAPLPDIPIRYETYFRYLTNRFPHGNVPWGRARLQKLRSLAAQGLIKQLRFVIQSNGPWRVEIVFSDLGKRIANRLHADKEFEPFPEVGH